MSHSTRGVDEHRFLSVVFDPHVLGQITHHLVWVICRQHDAYRTDDRRPGVVVFSTSHAH